MICIIIFTNLSSTSQNTYLNEMCEYFFAIWLSRNNVLTSMNEMAKGRQVPSHLTMQVGYKISLRIILEDFRLKTP